MTASSTSLVRQALVNFISTPPIAGLEKVYRGQPTIALGGDWNLADNAGHGAIGWMHIDEESQQRITLPALGGNKAIRYQMGLVTLYQYVIPTDPSVLVAGDEWVVGLDALVDSIKARLMSDPTFGTGAGGVIFEGGQDPGDLRIARDLPRLDNGKVWSWQVFEMIVTAIVTA